MKLHTIIFFSIITIFGAGCTKFLDVLPKGIVIPQNTSDYEGMLNALDLTQATTGPHYLGSDDYYSTLAIAPASANANVYYWQGRVDETPENLPLGWATHYNVIRAMNLVISEVMQSKGGSEQQKKQLYAEASFQRAFEFYMLMTLFSPAYDSATAKDNYGLPLVTSIDPNVALPARPSLQTFVDTLINTIVRVLPDLPTTNLNKTRATRYAGYALLSRIYMYAGNYTDALKYANMILDAPGVALVNYTKYAALSAFPRTNSSPGELFYRSGGAVTLQLSPSILTVFDTAIDLRCKLFFTRNGGLAYYSPGAVHPNCGFTYAELYLNKAECLARAGNIIAAMDIVNDTLRKKRFAPANYQALTAVTREEAITNVLAERRRELLFKNIRWSDMKRLDREGRMPVVKRLSGFTPDATVLAQLEPHSKNYTFQIPLMVQSYNPTIQLNK